MIPKFIATDLNRITFLSGSGSTGGFPLDNLKNYNPLIFWKSGLDVDQSLRMQFEEIRDRDIIIIHNHNLDSVISSVVLEASADAGFTSPVTVISDLKTSDDPAVFEFNVESYEYWRITAVSTPDELEIGQIFLDKKFEPPFPQVLPFSAGDSEFETVIKNSLSGFERGSQNYSGKRRIDIGFDVMPDEFDAAFKNFFQLVRGRLRPFYLMIGDSLYFVKFTDDFKEVQRRRVNVNRVQGISMREVYPDATP